MRSHYNEQKRKGGKSRRIMLYIHGGAYFFGSVDEHRYQMQRHARKLKARVFAPRYRLAPQFPFPCGLQDCLAAYLYLLSIHDHTEIILAGDSAGGGMVVALMCLLRDQKLPLPAGAILISPWVDLTHSFPSLSGVAELDYIPAHGFMHKPSASWPPPSDDEISNISSLAKPNDGLGVPSVEDAKAADLTTTFSEQRLSDPQSERDHEQDPNTAVPIKGDGQIRSGPQIPLSIDMDGKHIVLKEQIQMYTTNQLLAHPLVSPVLQPSLGGLPPVLILTGGGEILRDEQIYLAHKMANPSKYPLGAAYRSSYDPDDTILNKYKPTPVQLQVWEDLCHVAPTLSFTRPAKYMYRSIAQFGAWSLAKAQRRAIEIVDDDNISIISSHSGSGSKSDTERASSGDSLVGQKFDSGRPAGSVGAAGDPLPPFQNHMIRQRVDRHGRIYPLAETHDIPALQMSPDAVGVIKPGPVRKFLEAKRQWDTKYASTSMKIQKERIKALASGQIRPFEGGERPPPGALAARRTDKDLRVKKKRKSYGLAMWSMWGSKHDETTLKREEEAVENDKLAQRQEEEEAESLEPNLSMPDAEDLVEIAPVFSEGISGITRGESHSRSRNAMGDRQTSGSKARSRRHTISVTDTGQVEGHDIPQSPPIPRAVAASTMGSRQPPVTASRLDSHEERPDSPESGLLSPGFIPKFRTASHLRGDSSGPFMSDAASTMTGRSGGGVVADDASTRALFAAPGIIESMHGRQNHSQSPLAAATTTSHPGGLLTSDTRSFGSDEEDAGDKAAPNHYPGSDTPRSQRSLDRLQSHQRDEGMGRMDPVRTLSSTAVMRAEGIVGVVDTDAGRGEATEPDLDGDGEQTVYKEGVQHDGNATEARTDSNSTAVDDTGERPKLYDRSATKFQTAMEELR